MYSWSESRENTRDSDGGATRDTRVRRTQTDGRTETAKRTRRTGSVAARPDHTMSAAVAAVAAAASSAIRSWSARAVPAYRRRVFIFRSSPLPPTTSPRTLWRAFIFPPFPPSPPPFMRRSLQRYTQSNTPPLRLSQSRTTCWYRRRPRRHDPNTPRAKNDRRRLFCVSVTITITGIIVVSISPSSLHTPLTSRSRPRHVISSAIFFLPHTQIILQHCCQIYPFG